MAATSSPKGARDSSDLASFAKGGKAEFLSSAAADSVIKEDLSKGSDHNSSSSSSSRGEANSELLSARPRSPRYSPCRLSLSKFP